MPADTSLSASEIDTVQAVIARRLLAHASAMGDVSRCMYLHRYLAEHVAAGSLWSELAHRVDVLESLDPDTVAAEAFRSVYGKEELPAAIAVSMAARNELRLTDPRQRRFVRSLMAARLGVDGPGLQDPRLRWCRMVSVQLHLPLPGRTAGVNAVAFGRLADGRVLLATGGIDGTVRLWDPGSGTAVGEPLFGQVGGVNAVAFGRLADGRVLLAAAGSDGVWLWDPIVEASAFIGHTRGVRALAFGRLADGRVLLATTDFFGVARLWDPASQAADAEVDLADVNAVAFGRLADGRILLAAAGSDGVWLWDPIVEPPAFIRHTRRVRALVLGQLSDGRGFAGHCHLGRGEVVGPRHRISGIKKDRSSHGPNNGFRATLGWADGAGLG